MHLKWNGWIVSVLRSKFQSHSPQALRMATKNTAKKILQYVLRQGVAEFTSTGASLLTKRHKATTCAVICIKTLLYLKVLLIIVRMYDSPLYCMYLT